jgi:hypothetical protein
MFQDIYKPSVMTVILGAGEEHAVLCEGDDPLTGDPRGSVLLTSVLHVPTLGINLMSTPQLTSTLPLNKGLICLPSSWADRREQGTAPLCVACSGRLTRL